MAYPVCPKCGLSPLPADQSLPAACPACGIVLAKFSATAVPEAATHVPADDELPKVNFFARWLLQVPPEVSKVNWYGRIVLLVLFSLYTVKIFRETNIFYGDLGG